MADATAPRKFFCAIDCAPSEQLDLNNLEQWFHLACVVVDSEEHLAALKLILDAKCAEFTKNFKLDQYRSKGKPSAYAKQVMSGTSNPQWSDNSAVFVFSHQCKEIASGVDTFWRTLGLKKWIPKPKSWGDHIGPVMGTLEDGTQWETRRLTFSQGMPIIWIAHCLRLLADYVRKNGTSPSVEWNLVIDSLAGDDQHNHDKAKILVGCLTGCGIGRPDIQFGCDDRDSALDFADTFAGIACDCIRNSDKDNWREMCQQFKSLPHIHWCFGNNGPPFDGLR